MKNSTFKSVIFIFLRHQVLYLVITNRQNKCFGNRASSSKKEDFFHFCLFLILLLDASQSFFDLPDRMVRDEFFCQVSRFSREGLQFELFDTSRRFLVLEIPDGVQKNSCAPVDPLRQTILKNYTRLITPSIKNYTCKLRSFFM